MCPQRATSSPIGHYILLDAFLSDGSKGARRRFEELEQRRTFPPNSRINQSPRKDIKVYVFHSGRAIELNPNVAIALPVVPHAIYGILESLTGDPVQSRLIAVSSCDVGIIPTADLIAFLIREPLSCLMLAQNLARSYAHSLASLKK